MKTENKPNHIYDFFSRNNINGNTSNKYVRFSNINQKTTVFSSIGFGSDQNYVQPNNNIENQINDKRPVTIPEINSEIALARSNPELAQELRDRTFATIHGQVQPKAITPTSTINIPDARLKPPLPDYVKIDPSNASGASAWVDQYINYAQSISPLTPLLFHESAALWLASVAIPRRLMLPMAFANIYPNLFILWLAPTTLYRKRYSVNNRKRNSE